MTAETILVAGATGHQGGAVVNALLAAPQRWQVRALTRKPDSTAARRLAARGVEVVGGDMADVASLRAAMAGVYGAFSVQNTRTAGIDGEVAQGIAFANAARDVGIAHLVYSSVGGVERVRGIPHFDTKWRIEQHVRELGLPLTVLRPVAFMDVITMRGRSVGMGMLAGVLGKDKSLQLIATRDIGIFAATAFAQPERFLGQAIEIAGDQLTVPQIVATVRAVTGKQVRYLTIPSRLTRLMGPEAKMMLWFGESGYAADIPALRKIHPDLQTLDTWLRQRVNAG